MKETCFFRQLFMKILYNFFSGQQGLVYLSCHLKLDKKCIVSIGMTKEGYIYNEKVGSRAATYLCVYYI